MRRGEGAPTKPPSGLDSRDAAFNGGQGTGHAICGFVNVESKRQSGNSASAALSRSRTHPGSALPMESQTVEAAHADFITVF
jgi:hypothetical protein